MKKLPSTEDTMKDIYLSDGRRFVITATPYRDKYFIYEATSGGFNRLGQSVNAMELEYKWVK